MSHIITDLIDQAQKVLVECITDGADDIEKAIEHRLVESQATDTPAKFPLSFTITRDFTANKWLWKLAWSERHTITDETSAKDPNQIEIDLK
jgi:hypothetical protein